METYDINEAGQVHTYVAYLRDLPYEEQLYWKAHNEEPKASISQRAFTTDFKGEWHQEYDALQSLREIVGVLNDAQFTWWHRRSDQLLDRVHYPATNSSDEWSNEIMQLDQVAVEGFSGSRLRTLARALGRTPAETLGSLKLIEECLIGMGCEEGRAKEITASLHEVHGYRSSTMQDRLLLVFVKRCCRNTVAIDNISRCCVRGAMKHCEASRPYLKNTHDGRYFRSAVWAMRLCRRETAATHRPCCTPKASQAVLSHASARDRPPGQPDTDVAIS